MSLTIARLPKSPLRSLLAGTLALSWSLAAAAQEPAEAEDNKAECAAAYAQTQRLRQAGKLGEALAQAVFCAQSSCPELLLADCTRWVSELEAGLPTIVFEATDAQGRLLEDVRLFVDGQLVLDHLDGRALPVDPGEHVFRFERGTAVVERRAVVIEGSKAQHVFAEFPALPVAKKELRPPAPKAEAEVPVAAWVAGGVALAGAVGFAVFGLQGNAKYADLEDQCAPRCTDDDLEPMRRDWLVADVAGGVGLVSLGLAAFFVLSAEPREAPPAALELSPHGATLSYGSTF